MQQNARNYLITEFRRVFSPFSGRLEGENMKSGLIGHQNVRNEGKDFRANSTDFIYQVLRITVGGHTVS